VILVSARDDPAARAPRYWPPSTSARLVAVTRCSDAVSEVGRKPSNTSSTRSIGPRCSRSAVADRPPARTSLSVVSRTPIAADSAPGPRRVAQPAAELQVDDAGRVVAAEQQRAAADVDVARRRHRQLHRDVGDRQRAQRAPAVLAAVLLAAAAATGDAEVGQAAQRHPVEDADHHRLGVERPRDDLLGRHQRHAPADDEAAVVDADVDELALEPRQPALERAVVEGAVLDRHLDLLIERADADHRQVEHDLQPERQLALDRVEEAQPALAQRRRAARRARRRIARRRQVERAEVGQLEAHVGERRVRRDQLDAGAGRARQPQPVRQLDARDLQLEPALLVLDDEVARRRGVGGPLHAGQAGAQRLEHHLAGAILDAAGLAAQGVDAGVREVEAAGVAVDGHTKAVHLDIAGRALRSHAAW
jgi:hypothetical protein